MAPWITTLSIIFNIIFLGMIAFAVIQKIKSTKQKDSEIAKVDVEDGSTKFD